MKTISAGDPELPKCSPRLASKVFYRDLRDSISSVQASDHKVDFATEVSKVPDPGFVGTRGSNSEVQLP